MKTPFRVGRATAGVAFLLAVPVLRGRLLRAVAVWFGLSHLVAAATGYRGCPELGAIASLFTDEPVRVGCGPWRRLDRLIARLAA